MTPVEYPSLLEVNPRVWLTELSRQLSRPATLDDISDAELDRLAELGFDWVWLLSVWRTGTASRRVSLADQGLRRELQATLPDLGEEDIGGSGFAITGYVVHQRLGGEAALARLRDRLRQRGLRLMLDFVPNHTALDHPWVAEHPDYYVHGTEQDLARAPANYTRVKLPKGEAILAHGRDPYFTGWTDTLQLNYGNPAMQDALIGELLKVAAQCDGVRCDMAMLVLPEVFARTWGVSTQPFWPRAIQRVREQSPGFCFMAEVYWDLERALQQQGFDYTYDKRLYDLLREGDALRVREHFCAETADQNKMVRFLENHDEARAATAFVPGKHQAAAVITFLAPGLRLFHQGQFEGRVKRISAHLSRAPAEPVNDLLKRFYERLLELLRRPDFRHRQWRQLECLPAWDGNGSFGDFIAFTWQDPGDARILVSVNYSDHQSQCYVPLPFPGLGGRQWRLCDLLGQARYERDGDVLHSTGLYLDLTPWQYHVFELKAS
jgi:glycosidase